MDSNQIKKSFSAWRKIGTGFLLSAVCLPTLIQTAGAQSITTGRLNKSAAVIEQPNVRSETPNRSKIAPDLAEKTDELDFGSRREEMQRVIIEMKSETSLNEMIGDASDQGGRDVLFAQDVRANRAKADVLKVSLGAFGGKLNKSFNNLGMVSAELPLSKIRELAQDENVAYISPDREIQSFGHLGTTTGWATPGIANAGDADPNTWIVGGVGTIAVIDSGIDTSHSLVNRVLSTGASQSKGIHSVP